MSRSHGEGPAGRLSLDGRCGECLLYAAIQGMADGVVLVDPKGLVFHLNRSAQEMLGLLGRRVLGLPFRSVCNSALASFWASCLRDGGPATTELSLPHGPDRPLRVTVSPCTAAWGASIGRAIVLRDISVERNVQVELSAAVAKRLVALVGRDVEEGLPVALTRRERQILLLLSDGEGNGGIAGKLGLSVNTVGSHLKRLFAKIGVHNRTQAAAFAIRHRLVTHGGSA